MTKKKEVEKDGVKLRPVYVAVELHSRAKIKAAVLGVSLKSIVDDRLEAFLAEK